jgi:hypothetical protein
VSGKTVTIRHLLRVRWAFAEQQTFGTRQKFQPEFLPLLANAGGLEG